MKAVSLILIFIGIFMGLLAARSFWLDCRYEKASVSTEATISSMKIEPIRDGLSNVLYSLTYLRDGEIDTTEHKVTEQFTNKTPLPTIEQFQSNTFYIRYVPADRRDETSFPNRVMVLGAKTYPGFYNRALFGQMLIFILLGFMVRAFFNNSPV